VIGIIRSCLFLATYVSLFRYGLCKFKNWRGKEDRINIILSALISTVALQWEPQGRRVELGLFFVPRFFDSFWKFLLDRGLVKSVRNGEVFVFSLALGTIMYCY
jgi:hypothetical protein